MGVRCASICLSLSYPKDNKPSLISPTTQWLHPRVVTWVKRVTQQFLPSRNLELSLPMCLHFKRAKTLGCKLQTLIYLPSRQIYLNFKGWRPRFLPLFCRGENVFIWRLELFPLLRRGVGAAVFPLHKYKNSSSWIPLLQNKFVSVCLFMCLSSLCSRVLCIE